jgi:predicted nuclease of predicted toxin-antitoxin system
LKLLFDNNLSVRIIQAVDNFFPGSKHVADLQVNQFTDRQIFEFAGKNEFTVITKDKDFYHLVNTLGPPPKIVWIAVGNCSNQQAIDTVVKRKQQIAEFIKSTRSLFVINSIS